MISQIKTNIFQLHFNKFGSCVYLVLLENHKILIDASSSDNKEELIDDLKELSIKPEDIQTVLLTHQHWDHNGNLSIFKNAKVYDAKNIDELTIEKIRVIKTPGHSEDSLCFLYKDILFSGDTIFHDGGRGRTDIPGGSESAILKSIEKLRKLDYNILCPGHLD